MNEPGVEYASGHREPVRALAASWGISENRAAFLLNNPRDYVAECRSRSVVTGPEARRQLERRFAGPWLPRS